MNAMSDFVNCFLDIIASRNLFFKFKWRFTDCIGVIEARLRRERRVVNVTIKTRVSTIRMTDQSGRGAKGLTTNPGMTVDTRPHPKSKNGERRCLPVVKLCFQTLKTNSKTKL